MKSVVRDTPIAITGTGVISPLGVNSARFVEAIKTGQSAIRVLNRTEEGASLCEVGVKFETPFQADIDRRQVFIMDPVSQYAVAAAREAMIMAGLSGIAATSIGVVMGIGICGIETIDRGYHELLLQHKQPSPFAIPKVMPAAPASAISMALNIQGPAFCTTSACASSLHAIITGALWLQAGLVDAVIVGGAEAPFAPGLMRAWESMRVMATDTCRPFSSARQGLVLGEGAGALVLERWSDAIERDAPVLARIEGFAANADAGHIVKPDEDSITRVMTQALANAGLGKEDIGHINAHGTGTELNDRIESSAISRVFGASCPIVSATKGATGHTLGAAGALETIICVHALDGQWIPPTLNRLGNAADCADIPVSGDTVQTAQYQYTMNNAFAFGGLNAVLILSKVGRP